MRTRATAAVITAGLFFATLTACGGSDEKPKDQPKASAAAELTAKTAADKLADATGVTTLGHPTDNTSACATGKSKNDCTQLITTDTVSIYQFPSAEVAAHWVATMKKQGDWRTASRSPGQRGTRSSPQTSERPNCSPHSRSSPPSRSNKQADHLPLNEAPPHPVGASPAPKGYTSPTSARTVANPTAGIRGQAVGELRRRRALTRRHSATPATSPRHLRIL